MAEQGKGNFLVHNDLLYHTDQVLGQKVKQLCLPQNRRVGVMKLAHDVCHEGYKRTKEKIRKSFFWNSLGHDVKTFTDSCDSCQKKARLRTTDRIPISIVNHDEIPFSHLYMDCIGPLFDKADYNYCLCICDSSTRWPFAFPLRAQTAKAVCDCLIQVFSMVGVAKTITSDQGSCFTAQMSTIFMNELGCTPRFSTALHPEGNSLVERLNQSVKKMLHHVVRDKPKQWTKLLPYVLWCIRESRNETLGTSPFVMVYGRLPVTPLDMLVESWEGHSELPLTFGRSPVEILSELQQTLEHIHDEARTHSEREQQRHANFYNLKAKDKHFDVGQTVIVLLPDLSLIHI